MTDRDRERIHAALLQGLRVGELEAVTADDVEAIEPIVDDIEHQAELRGRFQTLLETAWDLIDSSTKAQRFVS